MTVRHLAAPTGPARDWDGVQFKTIYALSFAIYLPIAMMARLFPAYWRSETPHRSVLADACAGAGTTAQLAFWG
ncbi:protein of unknown function [Beijerinckiaceae bacterium RH AL1]|jgi:hypothetical protein|nr:hypothetical protein [Beijerinckiaceae bacterium]VVB47828.1 protein of unknown function [Beijerinckiaceae bacterium RH CH11]VVB47906.1 protein of unknown function [Beijerinckiaceae bacterium RH AL8]VVC56085.1 protein of unknown function [Beijerinckiaceae bacterium RH AL1]